MRFVKIPGLAGLMVASLLSWCRAEASDSISQEHGPERTLAQDQRVADLSRFEASGSFGESRGEPGDQGASARPHQEPFA
ncbi:MAG: hypothetical protein ABSH35_07665 [Isosphaeraceae bacterium]|jgi:hypothetical protein